MYKIVNLQTGQSDTLNELYDRTLPVRNAMLSMVIGCSPVIDSGDSELTKDEAENVWEMYYRWPVFEQLTKLRVTLLFNPNYVLNSARSIFLRRATLAKSCFKEGIHDVMISQLAEPKNQGAGQVAEIAYYDSLYKLFIDKPMMARLRFNRELVKPADLDPFIELTITDRNATYYSMSTWRRMIFEYFDICAWLFNINTNIENWHKYVSCQMFLNDIYSQQILNKNSDNQYRKLLIEPLVDAITMYYAGEENGVTIAADRYSRQKSPDNYEVY